MGVASSVVSVAEGANTTAETTGETTPGRTAPSSVVEVGLPVQSLIVTYPVWIANFPPGWVVDKHRGWLNHLVEKKAM